MDARLLGGVVVIADTGTSTDNGPIRFHPELTGKALVGSGVPVTVTGTDAGNLNQYPLPVFSVSVGIYPLLKLYAEVFAEGNNTCRVIEGATKGTDTMFHPLLTLKVELTDEVVPGK